VKWLTRQSGLRHDRPPSVIGSSQAHEV
jgi:hypothetical protein